MLARRSARRSGPCAPRHRGGRVIRQARSALPLALQRARLGPDHRVRGSRRRRRSRALRRHRRRARRSAQRRGLPLEHRLGPRRDPPIRGRRRRPSIGQSRLRGGARLRLCRALRAGLAGPDPVRAGPMDRRRRPSRRMPSATAQSSPISRMVALVVLRPRPRPPRDARCTRAAGPGLGRSRYARTTYSAPGQRSRVSPRSSWLGGSDRWTTSRRIAGLLSAVLDEARRLRLPWAIGELAFWLDRLGEGPVDATGAAAPFAATLAGDHRAAAEAWEAIGCPYEAAWALGRHGRGAGAARCARHG